jgi:hypothetical protein
VKAYTTKLTRAQIYGRTNETALRWAVIAGEGRGGFF